MVLILKKVEEFTTNIVDQNVISPVVSRSRVVDCVVPSDPSSKEMFLLEVELFVVIFM